MSDKWEYCMLDGMGVQVEFAPRALELAFFTTEGQRAERLPSRDRNKIAARIAELGSQGWEMVGAGNIATGQHAVYFKRRMA